MIFHPRSWIEPHLLESLDSMRFEWASFRGRFLSPKRISNLGREYLQLGCYQTKLDGFLNSDLFFNKLADAHIDARFPLPFDDGIWQGIYAHHIIEHLSYEDAFKLMRECHRTLRSGGVLRMVVPDLEVFLRIYHEADSEVRRGIFKLYPDHIMRRLDVRTPLEMIDYIFRDDKFNRHLSAWDWETAELRLREAGFSRVSRQAVNQSVDPKLSGHDKSHWAQFSLYVEAAK